MSLLVMQDSEDSGKQLSAVPLGSRSERFVKNAAVVIEKRPEAPVATLNPDGFTGPLPTMQRTGRQRLRGERDYQQVNCF